MKSFIRAAAALLLTVCIAALPPAPAFAAGSCAAPPQSAPQATEQSKVTPDPREITVLSAATGEWKQKSDNKWYIFLPCLTIFFVIPCLLFWKIGLKKYKSVGS